MQSETIKIFGYSEGDSSVGIGSADFEIDTGLVELSDEDKEWLIKTMVRDMYELHDNGNLIFEFSDEWEIVKDKWNYRRRFTYEDSKRILKEEKEALLKRIDRDLERNI